MDDFEQHFRDFRYALTEFGIVQDDIYNMDETGFRIGCLNGRIVLTHANTKAVYLADPDVRDWVTTIETISAGGRAIPAMIILAGSVMLEKHFDNDLDNDTLFGITSTGYSNNLMGMEYIQHFNRMIEHSCQGKYRMLMFDGHGSYISDNFSWFCWQKNIVPYRLPAHTTHLLQPLDVGIFQPLKHWHQVALQESIQYGDLEYSRADFLAAYQTMRQRTFKSYTIKSAWAKVGLFPWKPELVLDKVKVYEPDQVAPLETPMTPRTAVRSYNPFVKPFQTTPTTGNREAHRAYLNLRLMDHMAESVPLTPSYSTALIKYQKSVEPRLAEAYAIKARDTARALAEIEKTRSNTGSGKHVQKNGVIYKGRALAHILERTKEEQEHINSIVVAKIQRLNAATNKEYKKLIRGLENKVKQWKKDAIHVNKVYLECLNI